MFYTCTVSAEKTDGPHHGDGETCGHYLKKQKQNKKKAGDKFLCMQESVPEGSDSESDVFKAVSCLV